MNVRTYVTTSLFAGVVGYAVLPIDEPTLTYFFGAVLGSLLPMLPYQNKWLHSFWVFAAGSALLLALFPYYLVAGAAIGYGAHLLLDLFGKGEAYLYPLLKKEWNVKVPLDIRVAEKLWLLFVYATLSIAGVWSLVEKFILTS